jgi:DNA repair exonuclease SbcCD ATPase subunit
MNTELRRSEMRLWKSFGASSVVLASFALVGCDEMTTQQDVDEAREAYREEVGEAREASKEAQQQVGQEVREAEEQRKKLEQTESDFASDQTRKEYLDRQTRRLDQLEAKVGDLKLRSTSLAGEAKTTWDNRIAAIESKCEEVRDKLDELKSAETSEWIAKRDDVELALNQVESQLAEVPQAP